MEIAAALETERVAGIPAGCDAMASFALFHL